ncbi:hypothetical protein E2C01_069231 [Portunus trituberculatus]|uniref:Uncharacterized protein n=1 Tax=Portunus trituberculatus TaxID=210409 RepID=A0A5B7I287_PORTR|nr:hypothetical protein [Portunus trituberculatus]
MITTDVTVAIRNKMKRTQVEAHLQSGRIAFPSAWNICMRRAEPMSRVAPLQPPYYLHTQNPTISTRLLEPLHRSGTRLGYPVEFQSLGRVGGCLLVNLAMNRWRCDLAGPDVD